MCMRLEILEILRAHIRSLWGILSVLVISLDWWWQGTARLDYEIPTNS